MSNTNTQRIYFGNLDMLRFFAAYLIVLLHCFFGWRAKFGHPAFISSLSPKWLDKLELTVHNFSFGVDIFFLISGFLITYLLLSEKKKNGKVDVVKFYIRRALRIWPLYFFMILLAPLLSYFYMEDSPTYSWQFFFAGNFDLITNGTKSIATNHLWSICIEEHFYLFCPLLIGFLPLKRLPQSLLLIMFICILFRSFCLGWTTDYGMASYVHTLSRIDILALGSLFGYLFFHKKLKFDHPPLTRLIIYAILLLVFFNISFNESGSFVMDSLKKYMFSLPMAYWMGNFLFNPRPLLPFKKFEIFNLFGKVSYGIYMFNPVIIFLVMNFFQKYAFQNYFMFLVAVHVVLAITTYVSYRFFELPFLSLKEEYAVIKSGALVKDTGAEFVEEIRPEEGLAEEPVVIPVNQKPEP
jgi:peptidoglycan/LPS O-acetylase OafA/YrhL